MAQIVKNLPAMQETQVQSLGLKDPLEKEMAIYSSLLDWKVLWKKEPGGVIVLGVTRVGYHLVTKPPPTTTASSTATWSQDVQIHLFNIY